MRSIPDVFDALGGAGKLHAHRVKTNPELAYSTVASWKDRNAIPAREWHWIVEFARRIGKPSINERLLARLHAVRPRGRARRSAA